MISEHHDRPLQLQASRATKAEASALQWLVALLPLGPIHPGKPVQQLAFEALEALQESLLRAIGASCRHGHGDAGFQRNQALHVRVIACA